MLTLETTRLLLRLPQAADAAPLMQIHLDPEVVKYITIIGAPSGLTSAWRHVATMLGHWHLRGYGQWTVVERATGDVIGRVGFWNPEGWPGLELGWILERGRWGRGLATEAAAAALDWGWRHVDTDRVISLIQPDNHRSIRVAEKIGESLDGEEELNGNRVLVYAIQRPAGAGLTSRAVMPDPTKRLTP